MTYPSASVDAVGSDGAFVIGGGDFKFGQDYTQEIIKTLFKIPAPNIINALDLLREELLKLPLEALEGFKGMLPPELSSAFDTVTGAVDAIMGALTDNPLFMKLADFHAWVTEFVSAITSGVLTGDLTDLSAWMQTNVFDPLSNIDEALTELIDGAIGILTGVPVVGGAVADMLGGLQSLWDLADGAASDLASLINNLLTDPVSVIGLIPKALVDGLEDVITTINDALAGLGLDISGVEDFVKGVIEAITGVFTGDLNFLQTWFQTNVLDSLGALGDKLQEIIDGFLSFIQGVPVVGGLVTDFVNALQTMWGNASQAVGDLSQLLTDLWNNPAAVIQAIPQALVDGLGAALTGLEDLVKGVIEAITGVFTGDLTFLQDWFQSNVLTVFSGIPLAHIFDRPVNLLTTGGFDTSDDVSPTEGWSWDSGAAKVVCDGNSKHLFLKDVLPESGDGFYYLSAKVKTSGLTSDVSGTHWRVALCAVEYHGDAVGLIHEVATTEDDAADWVTVEGRVKLSEGTTHVVLRLSVLFALSGTVWFDDIDWHMGGGVVQDLIDGMYEALTGIPLIGAPLGALFTSLNNLGSLAQSAWDDLVQLLSDLWNNPAAVLQAIPQAIVDGLEGALNGLGDFIQSVIDAILEALTGIPIVGGLIQSLIDNVNDLFNDAQDALSGATNANDNLQTTWDELYDGFNGTTGSTGTTLTNVRVRAASVRQRAIDAESKADGAQGTADGAVSAAATAQDAAVIADGKADTAQNAADGAQGTADDATGVGLQNTSEIVELKAEQTGGGNSGYFASDTFGLVNATSLDTANWNVQVTGSQGHLGTNGADAYWVEGSATSGTATEFDYWKTPTNTDYQLVTFVIGAQHETYGSMGPVARCNSVRSSYVYVEIGYTTLKLHKQAGTSGAQIGNTYNHGVRLPPGSKIELIAGASTERHFQVKFNNQIVIDDYDDSGTLSVVGASNRYAGLFYQAYWNSFFYDPGTIAAWSVVDNTPPAYVGSGFSAYRPSGNVAITANDYNLFPNSFFSTESYRTADYTYSAATANKLTVSNDGWYHVEMNVGLAINTMVSDMALALYKNGSEFQRGGSVWGVTSVVGRGPAGVHGSFIVYLQAGDYIQPGYWQTTAYGASGTMTPGQEETYFSVSLINKSMK